MTINNLIIEVTRKCNFSCSHCLRGEAQNKNIDLKYIDALLDNNKIDYISSVSFTGGEPSLNIEAINYFVEKCISNNIEIGNFYIATNGSTSSGSLEFLQVLIKLYCYCSDNEISQVGISRSDWHNMQDDEAIEKLKCLSFVSEKGYLDNKYLLSEGKGKELAKSYVHPKNERKIHPNKKLILNENETIENEYLYINCKGDIILECDLSYKRQDNNKIGNIIDNKLIELTEEALTTPLNMLCFNIN